MRIADFVGFALQLKVHIDHESSIDSNQRFKGIWQETTQLQKLSASNCVGASIITNAPSDTTNKDKLIINT